VQKPSASEVSVMRKGQALLGLLQPLIDPATAKALADAASPRSASTRSRGR
jgi:hypothetical protein